MKQPFTPSPTAARDSSRIRECMGLTLSDVESDEHGNVTLVFDDIGRRGVIKIRFAAPQMELAGPRPFTGAEA